MIVKVLFAGFSVLVLGCGEKEGGSARHRAEGAIAAHYDPALMPACQPAARGGAAGFTDTLHTPKGVRFSVVTPSNYQSGYAHPLLIVFAPATMNRFQVERLSGFTVPATRAGFIVAYANHPPLGPQSTRDLDRIRDLVESTWCVDAKRVFYSGHSDGGTVSHALAVMPGTRAHSAGIAPSGAGMTDEDLASYGCPGPQAVMVTHAAHDELFPGWGKRTAAWWAACNACDLSHVHMDKDGCAVYEGCNAHAPTMYCEHDGNHLRWPARAEAIVDFFRSIPVRTTL